MTQKTLSARAPVKSTGALHFGIGNAKLGSNVGTFHLPSGFSCPGAKSCLAKAVVNKTTSKCHVQDGPHQKFRCFSASIEALRTTVRNIAWHNFDLVRGKSRDQLISLLLKSLQMFFSKNQKINVIRVHVGGDFFSQAYFDAWMHVASFFPERRFYAYTKSLHFWEKSQHKVPDNFSLVASEGGHFDSLASKHGFRTARVVMNPEEAEALNLEIDHDDQHAQQGKDSFALLIHGTQKSGSESAKATAEMRKRGIQFAYSHNKNGHRKILKKMVDSA